MLQLVIVNSGRDGNFATALTKAVEMCCTENLGMMTNELKKITEEETQKYRHNPCGLKKESILFPNKVLCQCLIMKIL